MVGDLTAAEVEQLLREAHVGRIGCHAEGRTYVVPVAYAYGGGCVYAQSADGLKVRTMRSNPSVCFEVEDIRTIDDWRTVIAWGNYEELWGEEQEVATKLLRARFASLSPGSSAHPERRAIAKPIFFRLRLDTKSGRFEKP